MIPAPASSAPKRRWIAPTVGLLVAAVVAILTSAPPAGPYMWARVLGKAIFTVSIAFAACAAAMRVVGPANPDKKEVLRFSAVATCFAPLVILLQQRSSFAPLLGAFIVWTLMLPVVSGDRNYAPWKKSLVSICLSILLQVGVGALIGEQRFLSLLCLGLAAAPLVWRIRQERKLPGPLPPRAIMAMAFIVAILGLMHYLPISFGFAGEASAAASGPGDKKETDKAAGFSTGGTYRGVVLIPEEEEHVILVPPLPMMGRDPFAAHKDPIGIPFYGVYWFFQFPDRGPHADAYKIRGTPDHVSFRSADRTPLKMEAHQNLGRIIEVATLSRIDVQILNADPDANSTSLEVILENTALGPLRGQSLGSELVTSRGSKEDPMLETLSFPMPTTARIEQFDELTIRIQRARTQATRSAKLAIKRFFLVPRGARF